MREYAVVYEWSGNNWAAYVPDLPGCTSTGKNLDEIERNIREAIEGHLDVMREFGEAIPEPTSRAGTVAIAA